MTPMKPDLSIVIVNWNTLEITRDCLTSVYDTLGVLNAEVIVVDNASSDGSADMVASEFPQANLIRNTDNRGFAAANNQGFEVCNGRHILLLNSDTIVHGDVLARSVAWMDQNPDAAAMGCRVLNADGTLQHTCSNFPTLWNLILLTSGLWKLPLGPAVDRYQMKRWDRREEREVEVISGCYMMVRPEAMKEVGVLDESFFFFGEETDWCWRFRKAGWSLKFAPVGEITHLGGASAAKLNHKRDVMLTAATVRLHRKHMGLASALAAFGILLFFNTSRAAFWTIGSLFRSGRVAERAVHFRRVLGNTAQTWPKEG